MTSLLANPQMAKPGTVELKREGLSDVAKIDVKAISRPSAARVLCNGDAQSNVSPKGYRRMSGSFESTNASKAAATDRRFPKRYDLMA